MADKIMSVEEVQRIFFMEHDDACNHWFDEKLELRYSFHLKYVIAQHDKFMYLLPKGHIENPQNSFSHPVSINNIVEMALAGHDVFEDTRMSYNDVLERLSIGNMVAQRRLVDIMWLCKEWNGKSRAERKPVAFYETLATDELAVYVKMLDTIGNMLYGVLMGSKMANMYMTEYQDKIRPTLMPLFPQYAPIFKYMDDLYSLHHGVFEMFKLHQNQTKELTNQN